MLKLISAVLADGDALPPFGGGLCEYIVAASGLFIRASSPQLAAIVPVSDPLALRGLLAVEPAVTLQPGRIPFAFLRAVLESARKHAPNESMYCFTHDGADWHCARPVQEQSAASVDYAAAPGVIVDLHSHAGMAAFFSDTDDRDEQGFGLYVVIGQVETDTPQIAARVGVYGHHLRIPAAEVFEGLGPFHDTLEDDTLEDDEHVTRCRECAGGSRPTCAAIAWLSSITASLQF